MSLIPSYPENDCRMSGPCFGRKEKYCADCKESIPNFDTGASNDFNYRGMSGNGFLSLTSDHNHIRQIKGMQGLQPVKRELCKVCYGVDRKAFYPHEFE